MAGRAKGSQITLPSLISDYLQAITDSATLHHSKSSEHLEEHCALLSYLASKGARHRHFRYYGTRERIGQIIDSSAIFLTDGSNWNDIFDSKNFNPDYSGYKRFGVCLSASTEESIAMWMLYGGRGSNGAMIDFDANTLRAAMAEQCLDCGFFEDGEFKTQTVLDAADVELSLTEVLYFKVRGDNVIVGRATGKDRQAELPRSALEGLKEITKHDAWSYEREVRLVARVSKLCLGGHASSMRAIRLPLQLAEDFATTRVYNSPASDGTGRYRDSELIGTVNWNLCEGCARNS